MRGLVRAEKPRLRWPVSSARPGCGVRTWGVTMTRTRTAAVALLCATLASVGAATPASARPADPLDGYVRPHDLGPDRSEWTCTYQVRYDEALCVYDPVPDRDMEPRARKNVDRWWNIWSWFLD